MLKVPENLAPAKFTLTPAELLGVGMFWLVYQRLDDGPVAHVRYIGPLVPVPGETVESLYLRAEALSSGED